MYNKMGLIPNVRDALSKAGPTVAGDLISSSIYVDLKRMARARRPSSQTAALLATLLDQPQAWRYGYDLSIATHLKSGTLYPLLMRLSDRGLLQSKWESAAAPGRPPRHMYRLTSLGTAYATEHLAGSDPQLQRESAVGVPT